MKRGLAEKPEDWAWSSFRHYLTGAEGVVEIESEWTAHRRKRMGMRLQVKMVRKPISFADGMAKYPHPSKPGRVARVSLLDFILPRFSLYPLEIGCPGSRGFRDPGNALPCKARRFYPLQLESGGWPGSSLLDSSSHDFPFTRSKSGAPGLAVFETRVTRYPGRLAGSIRFKVEFAPIVQADRSCLEVQIVSAVPALQTARHARRLNYSPPRPL